MAYFFGDSARVPAATNLHDRLMDLLLTTLSFSLDDPGAQLPGSLLSFSPSSTVQY